MGLILIVLPLVSGECPGGHCPLSPFNFYDSLGNPLPFQGGASGSISGLSSQTSDNTASHEITVTQDGTSNSLNSLEGFSISGVGTTKENELSISSGVNPDEAGKLSIGEKGIGTLEQNEAGNSMLITSATAPSSDIIQDIAKEKAEIMERVREKREQSSGQVVQTQPTSEQTQERSFMDALNKIRASMSSRGIYTIWSWLDYNSSRTVERTIAFPLLKGIGENLEDISGSVCWNFFRPQRPETSIGGFKELIPSMQIQAKRSTVIHYPGYYPKIGQLINPEDIEVSNTSTDLYYYRIIFSITHATDKKGSYEISLIGKAGDIEYKIHLTQGNDTLKASSDITESIARYWPVLLNEACVRIRDPNKVLSREFVNALPKKGNYYELCAPVVVGTAEKAPAGNPKGDTLE